MLARPLNNIDLFNLKKCLYIKLFWIYKQKSRIRETSNLSTDADCSTNTMRGLGSDDVTSVGQLVNEECTKGQNGVLQHKKCCVDASKFDPWCCDQ